MCGWVGGGELTDFYIYSARLPAPGSKVGNHNSPAPSLFYDFGPIYIISRKTKVCYPQGKKKKKKKNLWIYKLLEISDLTDRLGASTTFMF